jgi:hypothetical protein
MGLLTSKTKMEAGDLLSVMIKAALFAQVQVEKTISLTPSMLNSRGA